MCSELYFSIFYGCTKFPPKNMKRDERRKANAVSTIEGRVVDGVHRVWMQGGAVIILHRCCRGRIVSYGVVHKDGGTLMCQL